MAQVVVQEEGRYTTTAPHMADLAGVRRGVSRSCRQVSSLDAVWNAICNSLHGTLLDSIIVIVQVLPILQIPDRSKWPALAGSI